ncbi:membrane bound O-acyl transferase family protein [Coccomyxa subellipsoidea C-169]|uniref:Membrane bound O-acyl transferase family protein n=1 Tax=Coccomyxa subellipsoidea (strain C-169) TaxID=574566 RepID=I0Z373_COCSC|nr:membrane bound O-acyl transferase family protein [Coccomyxa subellipsoidea C-169]EIE25092.1 membrane bound O-acyl transferase family protein [Coccomyxa subellipsoidea C-169]|eukprot:XP_005649636.1 membrane bound O-acyl transferase family protein [Coccomyxa subellipsoidea C-169]
MVILGHELFATMAALEHRALEATGIHVSLLRFAISFVASVPVGALFKFIPTVRGKHTFAIVTGFALLYYPFGIGVLHLLVPTFLTYLVMLQVRENSATLSWVINFAYLIACHVAASSGSKWKEGQVDFTGAMMVLALKLISAGVSYQDGLRKSEELTPYQQAHKLTQMPSVLEWLSFTFASGNLLAGPYFELADYLNFIQKKGPWDPRSKQPTAASQYKAGALRFLKALICLGVHFFFVQYLPIDILNSEWYYKLGMVARMSVMWLVVVVYRFKYYFAWAVSEAGLIFSGFCFNGFSDKGEARWDRYANTRIRKVEFGTSAAELPAHWNTCTGNFLRRYVYERLTPRGKKATFKTLLVTQLVSGIWHGLFAGYVLFFASSAFLFESAKVIYRYEQGLGRRWDFLRTFPPLLFIKFLYTGFVLNYSAVAFLLLDFSVSMKAWKSVHFLGHFLMLAIILVSMVNPPRRPRKKDVAKSDQEATPSIKTGASRLSRNACCCSP